MSAVHEVHYLVQAWVSVAGGALLLLVTSCCLIRRAKAASAGSGEPSLTDAEVQRRLIEDVAPVLIWAEDVELKRDYFNRLWTEFSGRSAGQDGGLGWMELLHPDDAKRVREAKQRAALSQAPYQLEYRLRRADGTYRWILESSSPRRSVGGSFTGFIGAATDITEQTTALHALRDSECKFRVLVEHSLAGIYVVQDQFFKYVNPRMAQIFGYSPAEMTDSGMSAWAIVAPEQVKLVTEQIRKRWEGETTTVTYTFQGVRKDGRRIDLEVLGSITTYQGLPAIMGTLLDITARRAMEQELRMRNAELMQSQKMDAVGRLAGSIAHDYNNLLTSILGYAQLVLEKTPADDPRRRDLEEITRTGSTAARLTRQLLALGRREDLNLQSISVNSVLGKIGDVLRGMLGGDIELVMLLEEHAGCIEVDEGQLEQIILSLASNAREAMPRGGHLQIETRKVSVTGRDRPPVQEMPAGQYVALFVKDDGCGMSDEVRRRIFEPFFTTKKSGTGLGLALVRAIVEHSTGFISVESKPDVGTTISLYFPCVGNELRPLSPPTKAGLPRGTETILLVEDEETVRRLTARILTSLGYRVVEARNGEEGRELYLSPQPKIDLIITDIVMPVASGPEMIKRIRETNPDCRALFISGFSDGRLDRYDLDPGRYPLLTKPFTREALAQIVRQMLDRSGEPVASSECT